MSEDPLEDKKISPPQGLEPPFTITEVDRAASEGELRQDEVANWTIMQLFTEGVKREQLQRKIQALASTTAIAAPAIYTLAAVAQENAQNYDVNTAIPSAIIGLAGLLGVTHWGATRESFMEKLKLAKHAEEKLADLRERYHHSVDRLSFSGQHASERLVDDEGELPEDPTDLLGKNTSLEELIGDQNE